MGESVNRRTLVQALALGGLGVAFGERIASAQTAAEVKIAPLSAFGQEFDSKAFEYAGVRSLAVRVPAPSQADPRILDAGQLYLTAYTPVCTHNGCEPDGPNKEHVLVCPCHGSVFNADGSVAGGPAKRSLEGIKLEVRQGEVYATGKIA